MKKILITGASGFIGTNLINHLVEQNYLSNEYEIYATGSHPLIRHESVTYLGRKLSYFFNGRWRPLLVDTCIHLGANNDTLCSHREEMFEANVYGALNLFDELFDNGCQHFVYASSTAVYGNASVPFKESGPASPLNVYGESKLDLERRVKEWAAERRVTATGLRFCNVYGPHEGFKGRRCSMVTQLKTQIKAGCPVLFSDGTQRRDYIYVKDAVGAILKAMEYQKTDVFNCASGEDTSFNELFEIITNCLGVKPELRYIENPYKESYQEHTLCDIAKMKEELRYVPVYDIRSGIADYLT